MEVEDSTLLGLSSVNLLFQIDGPSGSSILVDNILFPGLVNGDFEVNLDQWSTVGAGEVTTQSAPISGMNPALKAAILISTTKRDNEGNPP